MHSSLIHKKILINIRFQKKNCDKSKSLNFIFISINFHALMPHKKKRMATNKSFMNMNPKQQGGIIMNFIY